MEHLALMEKMLGPIPASLISLTADTKSVKYFSGGKLSWPRLASSSSSILKVNATKILQVKSCLVTTNMLW
jgi:hypothetical protein